MDGLPEMGRQVREVLKADLGVCRRAAADISIAIRDEAGTRKGKLD